MKVNFPNILVIFRIALVPIIAIILLLPTLDINPKQVTEWNIYWTDMLAGVLFIIASVTDFIDGWYARKYNQVTTFGKLFDPLADKILVNSVLIIFSARGFLPIIFTIVFICRDILVDGLRMVLASNNVVLAADKWGKLKTIFQMIGLSLLFFVHIQPITMFSVFDWSSMMSVIIIPMMLALIFSLISGINYYIKGFKELNLED